MEKKLKRGLAELSRLFVEEKPFFAVPSTPQNVKQLAIERPEVPISESSSEISAFICSSFVHISPRFQTGDFLALLERTHPAFSGAYLISVASEARYREFECLFSFPRKEQFDKTFYEIGHGVSLSFPKETEIYDWAQARVSVSNGSPIRTSKKALVVWETPLTLHPNGCLSAVDTCVLDLLDHCVFVLEADLQQLTQAYHLLRYCVFRNPMIRNSIFLIGEHAAKIYESVYDRLSLMISQFLGCDLGFLGWADERQMFFNPELLLEEGAGVIQKSNMHLKEMLFPF
jgi:hypothetical protein